MQASDEISSYGVRERVGIDGPLDEKLEELATLGFCIVDSGLDAKALAGLADSFEETRRRYAADHGGLARLRSIDEHNTLRCPMAYDTAFLDLAMCAPVVDLVTGAIGQTPVLSQQNGIVNPPNGERYNQGAWHRDLPYLHLALSRPIALNALFCLDDFTLENGSTRILPGTHRRARFPSDAYVRRHAVQVTARAGQFIVLDAMLFHSGSVNTSPGERRAVNHLFTVPFIRQQIDLPGVLGPDAPRNERERYILGYPFGTPGSIGDYLDSRAPKG